MSKEILKVHKDLNSNEIPVSKLVADCYIEYGDYVNNFRAIPKLLDGLKPVYSRLIQTALEEPDQYIKTAALLGTLMRKYHPHGTASLNASTIPILVKNKIFDGQGNFGVRLLTRDDSCKPAAERYTEIKLNSIVRSQLSKIAKYVPTTESYTGFSEMEYIPTPIPFSLVFGSLGIGVGIGTSIPPFTMESLLDAYRSDDPTKLKLNYEYIIDDYSKIKRLWDTGVGSLNISIPTSDGWSGDQYGYYIKGYPDIFYPNLDVFSDWIQQGRIGIRDETADTPTLFISRIKRMRTPTDSELREAVSIATKKLVGFKTVINWRGKARPIGIKDWISITYNNYVNLIHKYIEGSIQSMTDDIEMWSHFTEIAKLLINRIPPEKITTDLNVSLELVNRIGKKSINTLVNTDPMAKITALNNSINEFKHIKPDSMVDEFVSDLSA